MRVFLILSCMFSWVLFMTAQSKDEGKFYGHYKYSVTINSSSIGLAAGAEQWYKNMVNPDKWNQLYRDLFDALTQGKLKAMSAADGNELTVEETKRAFVIESKVHNDMDMVYIIADTITPHHNTIVMDFHEDWFYDASKNIMTKKVTGIDIGKMDFERGFAKYLLHVPLTKRKPGKKATVFEQVYFDHLGFNTAGEEMSYHYFTNALIKHAARNTSVLRDTVFPFTDPPKWSYRQVQDSVFISYNFAFYEDWAFDVDSAALVKSVHAIVFEKKNAGYTSTKKVSAFVFAGFKPFNADVSSVKIPRVSSKVFDCRPGADDAVLADTVLCEALSKVKQCIDSAVNDGKIMTFADREEYRMNARSDYLQKTGFEIAMPLEDSLGNVIGTRTEYYPANITSVGFYEDIEFDILNQKMKRKIRSVCYYTYHRSKEFPVPMFHSKNYNDSVALTPENLVATGVTSEYMLSYTYLPPDMFCSTAMYDPFLLMHSDFDVRDKYRLAYSLVSAGQAGKIHLYNDKDSIVPPLRYGIMNDTSFFDCARQLNLPVWPLMFTSMQTKEDIYFDRKTFSWAVVTRELSFFRRSGYTREENQKFFTVKLKP